MTSYGLSHGAVVPDLSIFSAPIRLCAARPSGCRGGGPWARQTARMASVNVHSMLSGLILADTTHVKTDPPSICVECFGWRRSPRRHLQPAPCCNGLEPFHFQDLNPDGPPASYVQKAISNQPRSRGEYTWKVGPQEELEAMSSHPVWLILSTG